MANQIFDTAVAELERYVGGILARGMSKKALQRVGAAEDSVSVEMMLKALDIHIKPHLNAFMSPEKAKEVVRTIENKIRKGSDQYAQ